MSDETNSVLLMQLQLTVTTALTPPDNRAVTWLALLTGTATLGTLALWADRVTSTLGPTFTTTVWMVDRVHRGSAYVRSTAHPPTAAGFSKPDFAVVGIADLPDGCTANRGHASDFPTWQRQLSPFGFTSHQQGFRASRATHRSTTTRAKFDTAHFGADRNVLERHAVADFGRCFWAIHDVIAGFQRSGSNHVTFVAILVVQQCNTRGAIWVVLHRVDFGSDTIFRATKVDDSVHLLVSTATMPGGDFTLIVPSTRFPLGNQQVPLRRSAWRQISEIAY